MLIDSGSSATITRPWCCESIKDELVPVTIKALKQEFEVRAGGHVTLMLPFEDCEEAIHPIQFPCYVMDTIGPPEMQVDVLLNAKAGFELGYLAVPPSPNRTPVGDLPQLRKGFRVGGKSSGDPVFDEFVAMADIMIGEVLKHKEFTPKGVTCFDKSMIQWGEVGADHTNKQRKMMEALIDEFESIFLRDALPKPCTAEPVDLEMKDHDASLPFEKQNPWKQHAKEYLVQVRRQLESFGFIEQCKQPEGVSRVTLQEKDGGQAVRVCIDLRRVNSLLKDFHIMYKDGPNQVEKISSSKYRFRSSFDLASAYSQLRPSKRSQRLLTVWLPNDDGVPTAYTYKRLPFGLQTSGAFLQQFLDRIFQELPADMRESCIFWYVDDIVICSETFEDHLRHVRALFELCKKYGLTLSYKKAQVLCRTVRFYGMTCSPDGTSLSEERTAALRKLTYPKSVPEIRHVNGIFSVARRFVPRFAETMEPLTNLTKKGVAWHFGSKQRRAFDTVKAALLEGMKLHSFDPSMPLVLHTDASGTAEAAWLSQKAPDGELLTIGFWSKTFSQTMRRQGATAREAHAVVYGLDAIKMYSHASPFEVTVYTDCRSLTFVKDSTRSELSSRYLERIQDTRYKIVYKRGADNVVADAFSRLDLDGPDHLSPTGTATALDDVLRHLEGTPVQRAANVWVYVSEMTDEAYRMVQSWRGRAGVGGAMSKAAPDEHMFEAQHGLRILRFDPHIAVEMAREALRSTVPTAILMPLDLTGQIGADIKGVPIPDVLAAVRAAKKRAYVGGNALWILHRIPEAEDDVCLIATLAGIDASIDPLAPPEGAAVEVVDPLPMDELPDGVFHDHEHYGETRHLLERLAAELDVTAWAGRQSTRDLTSAQRKRVVTDPRGLRWLRNDRGPDQLLVPPASRSLILQLVHAESNHASAPGLAREVQRNYYWPTVAEDSATWVRRCNQCALGNVRRILHHNLYASSSYTLPRHTIGLDFKRIKVGKNVSELLLMVDRFSGFVTLAVLPERTAACVIKALDEEFVSIFGPPRVVSLDGAPEFRSSKLKKWARAQGIKLKTPLEYYPDAAGATERVWVMIRTALRRLKDFAAWRVELRQAVYQYNTLSRGDRASPFTIFFGGEPNKISSMAAAAARPPAVSDTDVHSVLADGAEAIRQREAADGDLRRRIQAVKLNKEGRTPRTYKVGDLVWYWAESTVPARRGDSRPRTATTPWRAGVVELVDGVRCRVNPLARGRGRRTFVERHVTRLKPRALEAEPPQLPLLDVRGNQDSTAASVTEAAGATDTDTESHGATRSVSASAPAETKGVPIATANEAVRPQVHSRRRDKATASTVPRSIMVRRPGVASPAFPEALTDAPRVARQPVKRVRFAMDAARPPSTITPIHPPQMGERRSRRVRKSTSRPDW